MFLDLRFGQGVGLLGGTGSFVCFAFVCFSQKIMFLWCHCFLYFYASLNASKSKLCLYFVVSFTSLKTIWVFLVFSGLLLGFVACFFLSLKIALHDVFAFYCKNTLFGVSLAL